MTGDDFLQWRRFMKLTKASAAEALGIGRNTVPAYEKSRIVPKHIELACAALACRIDGWSSIRDGNIVTIPREQLDSLRRSPRESYFDTPLARPRAIFGGSEPWLEDLLNDPVTHALMDRDGVTMVELREKIANVKSSLILTGQRSRQAR